MLEEDSDNEGCDVLQDGTADDDMQTLSSEDIATIRATRAAAAAKTAKIIDKFLDPPTETIADRFSSVLGDGFHFMDRPKVPMHHEYKKGYFVALQEAWFAWDLEKLQQVKGNLSADGLTDDDIEAKMLYGIDYFRQRVERTVLPPSKHYWHVRGVFEVYGNRTQFRASHRRKNTQCFRHP